MSRNELTDPQQATRRVAEIFYEIQRTFGTVPNLFRAYANHPDLLRINWEKQKAIMTRGELSRKTKQSIALAASVATDCGYCVAVHRTALRTLEVTEVEIERIERVEIADARERALVAFAVDAAVDPHGVTDDEVNQLRTLGFSSKQIVEALAVIELCSSYNRFANALAIPLDKAFREGDGNLRIRTSPEMRNPHPTVVKDDMSSISAEPAPTNSFRS